MSETTHRSSQYKIFYVSAGLIPKSTSGVRPKTYPYTTSKQNPSVELQGKKDDFQSEEPQSKPNKLYDNECPIDLSQKENKNDLNFLSKNSEFLPKSKVEPSKKPISTITSPVPAYLLASIANSAAQQHEKLTTDLSKSHMLQAYLTAKALHDVKIKQQQSSHKNLRTIMGNKKLESNKQFDVVSQLHQNFCRIYEKTVENDCVNLKRFRGEKEERSVSPASNEANEKISSEGGKIEKVNEKQQEVSACEVVTNKLDASVVEEASSDKNKGVSNPELEIREKNETSDKVSEKSENVSVTLETSAGKMILVNIPTDTDKGNSPPPAFLSKNGDSKLKAEFFPPSNGPSPSYVR